MSSYTEDELAKVARKIAPGEALDGDRPVGYATGMCDIDQDLRWRVPDLVCTEQEVEELEEMVIDEYRELCQEL